MKSILIKLIISLIIVIFVPLPHLILRCNPNIINIQYDPDNDCSLLSQPSQLGLMLIKTSSITESLLNSNESNSKPHLSWNGYLEESMVWLVIIFIILSIGEFTYKKLKKK